MTGIVHSYLDIILKLTSHLGHEQVQSGILQQGNCNFGSDQVHIKKAT